MKWIIIKKKVYQFYNKTNKQLYARFQSYIRLMRIDRPVGILLLLWPTLWGLWLSGYGTPNKKIVIIFSIGVFLLRSAGCIINDYADRNFDGFVTRTRNRPLVTKEVSVIEAWIIFGILVFLGFCLTLYLNFLSLLLAFVGLGLLTLYPFMKRWTYWPQLILGFAFSWSIPMGFAAQQDFVPPIAWVLFIASVIWTIVYDTQYAMVDREEDKQIGIRSTAILFENRDRLIVGSLQIGVLLILYGIGLYLKLGLLFFIMISIAGCLFMYQQYLMKLKNSKAYFKAFLNNQWVGFIIFIGFVFASYPP